MGLTVRAGSPWVFRSRCSGVPEPAANAYAGMMVSVLIARGVAWLVLVLVACVLFAAALSGGAIRRHGLRLAQSIVRVVPLAPRVPSWSVTTTAVDAIRPGPVLGSWRNVGEHLAIIVSISLALKLFGLADWMVLGGAAIALVLGPVLLARWDIRQQPLQALSGTISAIASVPNTRSTWLHVTLQTEDGPQHIAVPARTLWRAGAVAERGRWPQLGLYLQGWWRPRVSPIYHLKPTLPERADVVSLVIRYAMPLALLWAPHSYPTTHLVWRLSATAAVASAALCRWPLQRFWAIRRRPNAS